jgi:endogenous inhibitor of DNA gyrase (YacG/DUF329 family)
MVQCPNCEKGAAPRGKNRWFPFCCERCRTLDLGKWLNEEYAISGAVTDKDPSTAQKATNPPARKPEGQ